MINLFIPYFIDQSAERQDELSSCLEKNIQNPAISRVFLVCENPNITISEQERVKIIYTRSRPTYSTMFEIINSVTGHDDWNVLINSDIYTDDTIKHILDFGEHCFLALSRWDVDRSGNAVHYNTWDSQDTWCFKGPAKKMNADFYQGIAGCDNAIADRAEKAGYRVLNPSKTIKTYHLHNSGVRHYNPNNRVSKPYKLITPHE